MWVTFTHSTWSKLCTGFILNPKPDQIIICCTDGQIWNRTISQSHAGFDLRQFSTNEVWQGNDRRGEQEEDRGRRRERQEEGGPFFFDWSPVVRYNIFCEIYSLRLCSEEFSLLGSQFVCSTVPDSSWHVHVCM